MSPLLDLTSTFCVEWPNSLWEMSVLSRFIYGIVNFLFFVYARKYGDLFGMLCYSLNVNLLEWRCCKCKYMFKEVLSSSFIFCFINSQMVWCNLFCTSSVKIHWTLSNNYGDTNCLFNFHCLDYLTNCQKRAFIMHYFFLFMKFWFICTIEAEWC